MKRTGERGATMYLVIVFLTTFSLFAVMLLTSFSRLIAEADRERDSIAALYVADGGLAVARARLARDPAWAGGTVEVGRGNVEMKIAAGSGGAETREVHVRGVVPGGSAKDATVERRIRATLALGGAGTLPRVTAWREE
jgi:hypothetical protein